LIKWSLTLYQDTNTLTPTTYKLNFEYGFLDPETNRFSKGGMGVERGGKWTTVRGTKTKPDAVVYQLDPDKTQGAVSFLKEDENILNLLDRDQSLMVGNPSWSYTLSRAGNLGRNTQRESLPSASSLQPTRLTAPALPATPYPFTQEHFEGRSPCREVARQLNIAVNADCNKAKWDLTLYRDPGTHTPTTYQLKGTFYRQRMREGRWAIVQGAETKPGMVVYLLDPDKPQETLSFLKADENILFFFDRERNLMVGNEDFSYTLNRSDEPHQNLKK
jgi:hypothetical protein